MKAWLGGLIRKCINAYAEENSPVEAGRVNYRQFQCRHEFKIIDAANGGHVIVLADNYNDMPLANNTEPMGKVYIVSQDEKIGDVITTMLVERKLSK